MIPSKMHESTMELIHEFTMGLAYSQRFFSTYVSFGATLSPGDLSSLTVAGRGDIGMLDIKVLTPTNCLLVGSRLWDVMTSCKALQFHPSWWEVLL